MRNRRLLVQVMMFLVPVVMLVIFIVAWQMREAELERQEIRTFLGTKHQLISLTLGSIESNESDDLVIGQLRALLTGGSGLSAIESTSMNGFIDYCIRELIGGNEHDVRHELRSAQAIASRVHSPLMDKKVAIEDWNNFLANFPFNPTPE
ncbi:hypothetical protein [Paenibacillus daejeonensis]|uniref:hypothetical protein n=1 Tax=Paenibacillus daejeonensis TaxID=135193 RepID=UPI0003676914|nr:hypothetical protein [Paenibacillus daejeonensis]